MYQDILQLACQRERRGGEKGIEIYRIHGRVQDAKGAMNMKDEGRYILLTHRIAEEDGRFSAFCDELGLATCADSFLEAQKRLEAAVTMVLKEAAKRGEFHTLLSDRNIDLYLARPSEAAKPYGFTMKPNEWASRRPTYAGSLA